MKSIRTRLIATLICLAIVPLLFLGAVLTWQYYVVEIEQIKTFQKKLTFQASENLAIYLHEQEDKLTSLLKRSYLPDMQVEEQKKALLTFLTTSRDTKHGYIFDDISVLDSAANEIFAVSRIHLVKGKQFIGWSDEMNQPLPLEMFSKGKLHYSPVFYREKTGEPLLKISVPILDLRSSELKGILVTEMKLKFLWRLVGDMAVGNGGIAYIVDQNGRVIVHPNRSIVLMGTRFDVPEESSIMPGLSGEKSVVASEAVEFGGQVMHFVTEIPSSEAFAYINKSIFIIGTIMLVTLLGAIALVFIMVRQVIQPIESLARTAKEISNGDLSQTAQVENIYEFDDLAGAFNTMTGRLVETIQDLEKEMGFVENVIESLSHPFYVIDANDYTVKMANSAAHFNRDQDPLKNKCHMLTHHADEPCGGPDHPCTIEEIKRTGKSVVLQHQHCHNSDTSPKTYEVYGYPIFDKSGKITQVIEYNIDISEKTSLEEQLRQAQKMEAIGSLASGVAHDFNNLLTTILGYSELALMKIQEDDPQKDRLEAINEAGRKASDLTRQLLAFSRKQVLEMRTVNLNYLISNMTKMLGRLIGENIDMKMVLNTKSVNINADAGQIEQIVMNLAINARDAMPGGGNLTIETDTIELDEEYCQLHAEVTPGSYVMLTMTDSGHGMPSEVMEKIFEPFFTTKEKGTGTGLGLATVYGIIKQHKGQIYVYSELGKGTTFKLYFPEEKGAADEIAVREKIVMVKGTETILVVDDEPSIRKLVVDTLRPLGYNMIEAGNGDEAIAAFKNSDGKIDLLLTDVVMPGMSGRVLAETMLADRPDISVLYMSGYTDNVIAQQGVLDEGIFFINKPLVPSMLSRKVREVLDSNQD